MGRRLKRIYKPKCLDNVKYHKELHHTCLNPTICKSFVTPCEKCKDCKFYKLQEVDVADDEVRSDIDWRF